MMSSSSLFPFALLTIYLGLFASLSRSADWLRRLTRFLFGLFAITDLVVGSHSLPNAWILLKSLNLET